MGLALKQAKPATQVDAATERGDGGSCGRLELVEGRVEEEVGASPGLFAGQGRGRRRS